MKRRLFRVSIIAALAAGVLLGLVGPAGAYNNGFESDTIDWNNTSGTITQRANDFVNPGYADGIDSATGGFHARLDRGTCGLEAGGGGNTIRCSGPFTRWGGYGDTWNGPYQTQVDVYLDANYANDPANEDSYSGNLNLATDPTNPSVKGTRFDYTSAINNNAGDHLRDFGFVAGTGQAGSTCTGWTVNAQTNVNRINAFPDDASKAPACIGQSGWYTFKHSFSENASHNLQVLMQIIPVGTNAPVAAWTIEADPIATVGCNRYGWFSNQEIFGLPIDNASMTGGCAEPLPPTTGTWTQGPNPTTTYQAAVQQPINSANTSNWSSKSKGAIPVKFGLSSLTSPALFQSIGSDQLAANDFAFAKFTPSGPLTFNTIKNLSTDYVFDQGNCHGGSLRWQVRTDPSHALFIYYGAAPNFTDCTTVSQSGVNLLAAPAVSDLRFDTSQYAGGTFYDSYAHAKQLMGTVPVTGVSLVIDSGWQGAPNGDQRLTIANTTVNDNVYQWNAGGGGLTPTCDLPEATIHVAKTDPVADGAINEEPVQGSLVDSGNLFRVVDCKYMYNLSIPSLKGTGTSPAGTYVVEIKIDGVTVPTPGSPGAKVKFDIK
jgi:hypothetical protein